MIVIKRIKNEEISFPKPAWKKVVAQGFREPALKIKIVLVPARDYKTKQK